MMTRFSAFAAVAATAALIGQASSSGTGETFEEAVYVGCFHDSKEDRVLGHLVDDPEMTPKVCLDHCTTLGAAFMATQWGFQCWCSDDGGLDYNRHYEMMGEDAVCDMPCMGDETEMCGGFDSFSLYQLKELDLCLRETPIQPYEQCGGSSWTGLTCCTLGHECVVMGSGDCYSQCRPTETIDEVTPSPVVPEEPTTAAPVAPEETTTAPVAPEEPTTAAPVATEEPTTAPVTPVDPTPAPITPVDPTPAPVTPVEPTPAPVTPEEQPVAPPADDCMVVIIEGEDLLIKGDWKVVNDAAASGGKYIEWDGLKEGQNTSSPDDGDKISASFEITVAGEYSFQWLMRQPSGVESDKGNDSWLYFPNASRFGPRSSDTKDYGTFVKVYGRATGNEFEYSGTAEEANHDQSTISVEFDRPGTYTVEIAGRSHGHQIDQLIMFGRGIPVETAAAGC